VTSPDFSINRLVRLLAPKNPHQPTDAETAILDRVRELWGSPAQLETLNSFLRKTGCGGCIDRLAVIMAKEPAKVKAIADMIDPTGEAFKLPSAPVSTPSIRATLQGTFKDIPDTPQDFKLLVDETIKRSPSIRLVIRALSDDMIRVYFY